VNVDPATTRWAKEYVVVYSVDGGPDGRPERVPGQYGIYDSRPGDDNYSPIWRYNYVVVPRDYEPNALRSEQDCIASGYPLTESDTYTN
jgi:hypothetical protein